MVLAPSMIPRKSGDRQKNDKCDTASLAEVRPETKKPGEIRPRHYRGLRLKKPKHEAADEAVRKALEKHVVG